MWEVVWTDTTGAEGSQTFLEARGAYQHFENRFAARRAWNLRKLELFDANNNLRETWELNL